MKTYPCPPRLRQTRVCLALLISFMMLATPVLPPASALSAPPRPLTAVVTATKTDSFPDPDGDGKAEPGDTITYDVNVANASATDATGVVFSDTIDPNTTLVAGSLRVSPLAFADSYNATRDIALSITAPGVLSNDTGTPQPTAQAIAAGPTAQGGTVTLGADGSFTYTPAAGFQGADTFNYTATNGLLPNDAATVTINVDAGPAVATTSPANGATGVAPNSNITVNFTEPVNATTASFSVECPAGSPQTFTLSASPAASFTLDPAADLPAGTTCAVTVLAAQITDADTFDPPDQMAADYTFSFGTKPLAVDDMRSATGNVRINTATTGYSVLANDQSGPGTTITAFDATSANGGAVTMNTATGTFTYDPPRGFTGTDSFNYTIGNAAGSDQGAVVLTVSDMLWFINNAAGACSVGCDGRLTHPYATLAAFDAANGTVGVGNPEAGDDIFLHTGGGNYAGPLTLENDQKLIGQGAPASISAITGITFAPDSDPLPSTGGARPVITTGGVAQSGVLLAQNDQLHGLSFVNTTGTAIRNVTGGSVGTFLMNTVSVSNTTTGGGVTFNAGGTVEATGTNTISTGSGTALNVANTSIGPLGLTFRSISAGTAVGTSGNGVILNNTGSAGGLTVTGNGSPGSGGTIQNKNGPDGSATQGTCVLLNNSSNVSLAWMSIQGCQNYGIRGTGVSGFTLDNSLVGTVTRNGSNSTADANPATLTAGEGSLRFTNLTGTAAISNSTLDRGFTRTVFVENDVATALNLSVTDSTVRQSLNSSNGGDANTSDAIFIEARSAAAANLNVTGSHFTAYRQFAIQTRATDTATVEVNISGSDFSNSNAGNVSGSGSLALNGDGTDCFVKFNIHDNAFRHGSGAAAPSNGGAHLIAGLVAGAGKFDGRFVNNVVGVSGIADSGAGFGADALRLLASGNSGTARVTGTTHTRYLVKGNTIQRYGEVGIQFNARQGNAVIDATVLGNIIREPSTAGAAFAGIWANAGALPADANVLN
ncbi:MAG TPA: Ig-like domain-containing protein, partial [Pyrinomonadaceae bacterium]|nr:Ig-like domain-containing protein [Pyrinomonadaceae bacterium]